MADMTVQDLATEIRIPVDDLVAKLRDAGIAAENAESTISGDDKLALLRHLRGGRAAVGTKPAESRISVPSRKRSQLKVTGQRGAPGRTVNVEVRKRRTFVRKDAAAEEAKAAAEAAAAKQAEQDAAAKAAEEAKQAELAAQAAQEAQEAQAAKEQAEQEAAAKAAEQQAAEEAERQAEAAQAEQAAQQDTKAAEPEAAQSETATKPAESAEPEE